MSHTSVARQFGSIYLPGFQSVAYQDFSGADTNGRWEVCNNAVLMDVLEINVFLLFRCPILFHCFPIYRGLEGNYFNPIHVLHLVCITIKWL